MALTRKAGRRPVDQAGPGRQEIWEALQQWHERGTFTISDIAEKSRANRKSIHDYLACLTAGGYVRHNPALPGQAASYELLRNTGIHAPRLRRDGQPVLQGQATEQMWRAMVMLKCFSFRDLIQHASVEISEETARSYCKTLLATGYLRVIAKADPARGIIARYELLRDSGIAAPQIQRVKCVYDPNTGLVHHPEGRA